MSSSLSDQQKTQPSKGFIYVASVDYNYLKAAIYSAISLKDYWPEANVTLFIPTEWYDSSLHEYFDNVITGAPQHARAKLWALSKTPYDLTVYLDADVEIVHSDIKLVFDQMTDTADIMLTKIRGYNGKISVFPGGELTDHCGMFMYNSKRHTRQFMVQWWDLYQKQHNRTWQWDTELYPEKLRPWDQWTFWWLQNKTEYAIVKEYFPDDARWNFVNGYRPEETDKDIVIYHHTLPRDNR